MYENDKALDWGDVIGITLLPKGTYPFTVRAFERGEFPGSEKLPPCKKAVITLEVDGGSLGTATITENLLLLQSMQWKIHKFAVCIGQRQEGEEGPVNWQAVPGARGLCEIGTRTWKGKDGAERESNQVLKYLAPSSSLSTAPAAPAAPAANPGGYQAGQF